MVKKKLSIGIRFGFSLLLAAALAGGAIGACLANSTPPGLSVEQKNATSEFLPQQTAVTTEAPTLSPVEPALSLEAPAWQQVNASGFGSSPAVEIGALAVFNGSLYAGASNPAVGAHIFRSQDGTAWIPVSQPGFGIPHDTAPPSILDLEIFNNRLYASTGQGDGPGQIWRSLDGVNWAPMVIAGFGDEDTVHVTVLAEYNGMLYAGASNQITGAQIWRSYTGDNNTWTQVQPVPVTPGGSLITAFAEFDGGLYAAVESHQAAQVWRSFGGEWTAVISDGFGEDLTTMTGGMAVFGPYLYLGAGNDASGAELWRTADGVTWEQVTGPVFEDPNNQEVELVFVFLEQLYIGFRNGQIGIGLWRSLDGSAWEQANQPGFGDSNNTGSNSSNAAVDFGSQFYLGTVNFVDGGELWRMQQQIQPPDPPPPDPPPALLVKIFIPYIWRQVNGKKPNQQTGLQDRSAGAIETTNCGRSPLLPSTGTELKPEPGGRHCPFGLEPGGFDIQR